jgi:hypothetical protein
MRKGINMHRMDIRLHSIALALVVASVASPAIADDTLAAEGCEAAVAETIKRIRPRDAREIRFVGAGRAIKTASNDEIGVTGEGQYQRPDGGSMPFTYSCAFNAKTGGTSGVLFREAGGVRESSQGPWQPDLTHLSPTDCESAVAGVLKEKYPHVGKVEFDAHSRRLQPAPNARTSLEGKGKVQRAPGMTPASFGYHCEVDSRTGKVVRAQAKE